MERKILSIVLTLLFVLAMATGCASTNSSNTTTAAETTAAETTAAETTAAETTAAGTTAAETTAAVPTAGSSIGAVVIAGDADLATLTTSENRKTLTFIVDAVAENYVVSSDVATIADFLTALNTALSGVATAALDIGNHLEVTSATTGVASMVTASGDASVAFMGATPTEVAGTN